MSTSNSYDEKLASALDKANPVLSFDDVFKDIPFSKIHERPDGLPYSIWELSEHLRIAQHTYLHVGKDAGFKSPKWPDEFWPKKKTPTEKEWEQCLNEIHSDRREMAALIRENRDQLLDPLDHAMARPYSIWRLPRRAIAAIMRVRVVLRRLLGIWKSHS